MNFSDADFSAEATLGPSKTPAMGMGSSLGDLMIKNCYKNRETTDNGTLTYDSSMPPGVAGKQK